MNESPPSPHPCNDFLVEIFGVPCLPSPCTIGGETYFALDEIESGNDLDMNDLSDDGRASSDNKEMDDLFEDVNGGLDGQQWIWG